MRILMLGWEFPPFIAGGLGTACYGMTRALDRMGHEVIFVLPRPVDRSKSSHIRLLSPAEDPAEAGGAESPEAGGGQGTVQGDERGHETSDPEQLGEFFEMEEFEHVVFRAVPARFASPYPEGAAPGQGGSVHREIGQTWKAREGFAPVSGTTGDEGDLPAPRSHAAAAGGSGYAGDMVAETERYARMVLAIAKREKFDVIHAHDWMTYPAGLWLARATGKPLVAHIHSTEFDRAGENGNPRVHDIERRGMMGALRVIAVSMLTKSICARRYGIDPEKIDVVYNGIDSDTAQPAPGQSVKSTDKIVLFLGRITMQKGPEYFIRAAQRVLEKVPNAKFIVAGDGDLAVRMIEQAASIGIGHRVLFTGFLRGEQVDRIFRMADCYVMPSVSEPFGIAPLEAMRNDVPAIISKQSGVSEVLSHVLKVDFWDVEEMANKIVAVLRHPPLGQTLRANGSFELRRLTWDGAAQRYLQVYDHIIGMQRERAPV